MYLSSHKVVSQPDFSSSTAGPHHIGQLLPSLITRIGLRCIAYQSARGEAVEARRIFKTLNTAVSFERAA